MRAPGSIWRARLLVGVLGLLVLGLVGGGIVQAWNSAERARLLRHQLVAERLFDSMEAALSDFLEDEEARPFVEYRPEDGLVAARAQYVNGYFQFDPEGNFSNPHDVAPSELQLLATATAGVTGWGNEDPTATGREVTVSVPVQVPPSRSSSIKKKRPSTSRSATPSSKEAVKTVAQGKTAPLPKTELPVEYNLNNSIDNRGSRSAQKQRVNAQQAQSFLAPSGSAANPPPEVPQAVQQQAVQQPAVQQQAVAPEPPPEPREVWVPVTVEVPRGELIDVAVEPFVVRQTEDGQLVLTRTVRMDRRTWVQGLSVDVAELQAHMAATSLGDNELTDFVTLDWTSSDALLDSAYVFGHDFAEPFEGLHLTVGLAKLPDTSAGTDTALQAMSALLLFLAFVGLIAVYRTMAVTMRYAEQRADFVSAVTHELKSPLTSIRMYSEMLESGIVEDDERRNHYYTTIRLESERLGRLVEDVLAFSRIERGLPAPKGDSGTIGEVVDDVAKLLQPQVHAAGAELELLVEDTVRAVSVDRDALAHVLTNLVDNALKFSADAENRTISVVAHQEGDRVALHVRDRGPGVPAHLVRRIFEPFFRGERELTRKTKGTGIGLSLVTSLVERMEGAIEARNHPEGGFEVVVAVPVG